MSGKGKVLVALAATVIRTAAVEEKPLGELVPKDLHGNAKLVTIARAVARGYGKDFGGVSRNSAGNIVFVFVGQEILYDDGKKKTAEELLDSPDLEDTFSQVYPLANPTGTLPADFDPGRRRVEGMFKALYGASAAKVAETCIVVPFCGHKVRFTARCGAATALEEVGHQLAELIAAKPAFKEYVSELGGTFSWRFIAGTERLSNHSFANAIDLNVKKSEYWRWAPEKDLKNFTRNHWPTEIISIFESHGFIWGGKWWHYDTMHFEFRPELIEYAKIVKEEDPKGGETRIE